MSRNSDATTQFFSPSIHSFALRRGPDSLSRVGAFRMYRFSLRTSRRFAFLNQLHDVDPAINFSSSRIFQVRYPPSPSQSNHPKRADAEELPGPGRVEE